jgi:hypothetical protein
MKNFSIYPKTAPVAVLGGGDAALSIEESQMKNFSVKEKHNE